MVSDRKITDLIALVRHRYDDWTDFDHPGFVADEISYKQATVTKAQEWLSQPELDKLITSGDFDLFRERLLTLSRDNNLLFRRIPSQGDTAVLHHPSLDKPTFCTAVRNLLHGDRPSPARLQSFSDYCAAHDLPDKWPFPTYLLFITHPEQEMFVKPRTAGWFLKFMGVRETAVTAPPTAAIYTAILEQTGALFNALLPYGAQDRVDVQGFLWVCYQEGKERIGRLSAKGQVDLDIPPTKPLPTTDYHIVPQTTTLKEVDQVKPYPSINDEYSLQTCSQETGFSETELLHWVNATERKGQAIFYGPPGTGKTFMAEKMARHLIGGGDGFMELVQFHPAYAYEDFMQGIRPLTRDGLVHYQMVPGRFMQFCEGARGRNGRCVLIIDEINRANIASVFGELMYLLEYRDRDIPLAGGGRFNIPVNVRLLSTMNTADRSIALVDHALRRRFAFIHLAPNYDTLRHFHRETGFNTEKLITLLNRLNNQIGDPHYYIGPAFFMHANLPEQLKTIWQMEIEPYVEEYFFDQPDTIASFRWAKLGMTNDE